MRHKVLLPSVLSR